MGTLRPRETQTLTHTHGKGKNRKTRTKGSDRTGQPHPQEVLQQRNGDTATTLTKTGWVGGKSTLGKSKRTRERQKRKAKAKSKINKNTPKGEG